MDNKLFGMLGLAKRARKIVSGESVIHAIQNKSAHIVLISQEASENTIKKIKDKCQYYNITFRFVDESVLNSAIGEYNRKAIAITDEGMSKKIMQLMKG